MNIAQDKKPDNTVALLTEGYNFIRNRCARFETDIFATRFMLRPVICMLGEEAARQFYTPGRFARENAIPPTTLMLLQDKGSVQLREGAAHAQRKQLFMKLMHRASIERLLQLFRNHFQDAAHQWERQREVALVREFEAILTDVVCEWAGVPLEGKERRERSQEFAAMIEGAGSVGPKSWWALLLRGRSEQWAQRIIAHARSGDLNVAPASPLFEIAWHREDGELLDEKVAAVELLNLLRPTVAVSRYLTFAALALHDYPDCREKLREGDEDDLQHFTQEVRRFYPFFPFIGGRVKEAFDWRGQHFAEGSWVLLDLYGTNHDPRIWDEPERFNPERFRHRSPNAYDFIPQGGGEFIAGHRCAGEWLTIELIKTASDLLVNALSYEVPEQDLRVDLSQMPALPASGLVINRVRAIAPDTLARRGGRLRTVTRPHR